MRAEAPEPSIRGSYIGPAKAWIQEAYGKTLWEASLNTLPADQQTDYRTEIVSLQWYALGQWTAVLDAVRANVLKATGESGKTFDRRNIYESISGTMQTVYRIAFSLLSATTVIAKVTPYFKRVYSHGEYKVIQNVPGRCVIRFSDAPVEMLPELQRSFPLATNWMLDVAGQVVTGHVLTPKLIGDLFSCDLTLEYQPKK